MKNIIIAFVSLIASITILTATALIMAPKTKGMGAIGSGGVGVTLVVIFLVILTIGVWLKISKE